MTRILIDASAGFIACIALSVSLAWLLRAACVPGGRSAAAIVAGISIGLLLGPGVFGKLWPDRHEKLFVGASAEQADLAAISRRHAEEILALTASGVTADAIAEHRIRQQAAIEPIIRRRDEARRLHRQWLDGAAQAALACYFVCIGGRLMPRARTGRWRHSPQWAARSLAGGFVALLIACIPPLILATGPLSLPARQAIAFALIMGAPGVAASLRPKWYLPCIATACASASAALLIGWSIGMTIVATGIALGLMLALAFENDQTARILRNNLGKWAHNLFLPSAAAAIAVTVDLHGLTSASPARFWWAIVIALIWSSDGRWAAWLASARWIMRERTPWLAAANCVNAGAGIMQLSLTIVLAAAGLADGNVVAAGLLGAAIVEVTRPARKWLALALVRPLELGA